MASIASPITQTLQGLMKISDGLYDFEHSKALKLSLSVFVEFSYQGSSMGEDEGM